MKIFKFILATMIVSVGLLSAKPANAAPYNFNGTVTLCTGTCDSFASLSIGTEVSGIWEILTTPNGSWTFADVGFFGAELFNPGQPFEPFDGTNPTTANPLPLTASVAQIVASGGGLITGGTTDADEQLSSGTILHEFVIPPFTTNGAWLVFDIGPNGSAVGQVCLFFLTAGCIPGATQVLVFEGQFTRIPIPAAAWLLGSTLLALLGVSRRAPSSTA